MSKKDVSETTELNDKPNRPAVDMTNPDTVLPNSTATDSAAMVNKGVIGNLTITDSAAAQEAQLLHDAVTHKDWPWHNSPDVAEMERVLNPENSANRAAVEAKYAAVYGTKFRDDLSTYVGGDAASADSIKTLLTRVDGRTNFGGDIQVALDIAQTDSVKGNRLLRAAVLNLNSEMIPQAASDIQAANGTKPTDLTPANATEEQKREFALGLDLARSGKKPATPKEAEALYTYQKAFINNLIGTAPGITDSNRQVIATLTNGVDLRSADDIKKMANIAVASNDIKMLADVVNGVTPAAIDARQQLSADSSFMQKYNQTFASDDKSDTEKEVAADLLSEGNISLATIIKGDTGVFMGLLDNPENLDLAASKASPQEQQEFNLGKALSLSGRPPANDQDSQALAYYNKIDQAMTSVNMSYSQRITVEDELQHGGKTLASNLIDLGRNATAQQKLNAIENMSQADYDLLHKDKSYMDDVVNGLVSVGTNEDFQPVLNKMLAEKAAAPTFEASQGIKRSVLEVYQGMQNGGASAQNVTDAIATMSPSDAAKYQGDADYRKQIDDIVQNDLYSGNDDKSNAGKYLATSVLEQVAKSGATPELTAAQLFVKGFVDGAPPAQQVSNVEKLLQDPSLRARLAATSNQSPDDQALLTIIQKALPIAQEDIDSLLKTGVVPVKAQITTLDVPTSQLYTEVAKLPAAQQAEIAEDYNPDQREILDAVVAQNGTMRLEDKIRDVVVAGGSYQDLQPALSQLKTDAEKYALIQAYATKYNSNLSNDLMSKVSANDAATYQGYISPSSDGDQAFFNDIKQNGGDHSFTFDASGQVIDRSLQSENSQIAQYQAQLKKLPPDVQAQITELVKTANAQNEAAHIDDIVKLGKGAVDVAAVVAVIASLGTAAPAEAAAGAVIDVAVDASTTAGVDAAAEAAASSADFALPAVVNSTTAPLAITADAGIDGTSEAAQLLNAPDAVADMIPAAASPTLTAATDASALTETAAPALAGPAATPALTAPADASALTETAAPAVIDSATPALTTPADASALTETAAPAVIESATPAVTESATPAVTESTTPAVTESATPAVTESATPAITQSARAPFAVDSAEATETPLPADSATAGDTAALNGTADTSLALKPAAEDLVTTDASLAATDGTVAATTATQAAAAALTVAAIAADKTTDAGPTNGTDLAPITVPNDNIIKLASVRRGEGPFQSAERILFQAEGKRPGIDEVRTLTKALQQTFSPERNGDHDMGGLKVNYQFITKENFADVIAAVQDPTVKAQLMQFAAAS